MKEISMNQEKLAKLQEQVRIGGKVRCSMNRIKMNFKPLRWWLNDG